MDLKAFLYLGALVAFAFGCRTFDARWLQKLGWLSLLLASYLMGWWLTGSHVAGAMAVLVWFLLPAFEIATRVRRLRFPLRHEVKGRFAPSGEVFPNLHNLTDQLEECGYEKLEDAGWEAENADHFVRLFYNGEKRTQATINLDSQGEMGVSYVSLTTRTEDGWAFTTTSFPYAPPMEFSPRQVVSRFEDAETVKDLDEQHLAMLEENGVLLEKRLQLDTELLTTLMEEEMGLQVDHNMERGLIEKMGEDQFRYSWRGCFFLWFQTLKEMLRV